MHENNMKNQVASSTYIFAFIPFTSCNSASSYVIFISLSFLGSKQINATLIPTKNTLAIKKLHPKPEKGCDEKDVKSKRAGQGLCRNAVDHIKNITQAAKHFSHATAISVQVSQELLHTFQVYVCVCMCVYACVCVSVCMCMCVCVRVCV